MMVGVIGKSAIAASLFLGQSASAALVSLTFDGQIGPMTIPATLNGGNFDGTIQFDDAQPFPNLPATLTVLNGPLGDTYSFGAAPGAFVPSAYRVTYNPGSFQFQGTSDDGASLTFDLMGRGNGAYAGSFAFARGSDFSAVGNATIGSIAAVPETATWMMMILGLGIVGGVLRRRTAFSRLGAEV
jgi:hypothetical protein